MPKKTTLPRESTTTRIVGSSRICPAHASGTLRSGADSILGQYLLEFMDALSIVRWNRRDDTQCAESAASWLINGKAVAQESLAWRALLTRDNRQPTARAAGP